MERDLAGLQDFFPRASKETQPAGGRLEVRLAPKFAVRLAPKFSADANIRFDDLRKLLTDLGFQERSRGSHHVFAKPGIEDLINLQREGNKAKPYQVRQVRSILLRYRLGGND